MSISLCVFAFVITICWVKKTLNNMNKINVMADYTIQMLFVYNYILSKYNLDSTNINI